jgi:hypothetical protein
MQWLVHIPSLYNFRDLIGLPFEMNSPKRIPIRTFNWSDFVLHMTILGFLVSQLSVLSILTIVVW